MNVDDFIARWRYGAGGQERANYAMFLLELCDVLGVRRPEQAGLNHERNDYVFERRVAFSEVDGPAGSGRIDLYKRGTFVCECKQSRRLDGGKLDQGLADQLAFEGIAPQLRPVGRADAGWDALMKAARYQAARYVRALPKGHIAPPFLIVCDIGRCFELYADFSGTGRHYELFPDRKRYRIFLEDLRNEETRALLRAVWEEPHSLDPTRKAAEVTRAIARRLAHVARALESREGVSPLPQPERGILAEDIALFLMRLIFSMFAEDVGLLPNNSVRDLLRRCQADPDHLGRYLPELWSKMAGGPERFSLAIGAAVKHFNGGLFENARVFRLEPEEIGELIAAAEADWRTVEPAIFGTLLEQALDSEDRAKLGAHYTPRAYVESLVNATIMEPLRARWERVHGAIELARSENDDEGALAAARAFLGELTSLRVLDPACGTGNFLYVAMLLMKRLEAEVRETILDLRGGEDFAIAAGETIDPHNFLGLELNPRAAAIAELVLWIGYLQWHFANHSSEPAEPILRSFGNINGSEHGGFDAVLAQLPSGAADIENPRRPTWPDADFIVGNPPFIGGKDIRERLGSDYAEALWRAHPKVPRAADLVMYWWDRAADVLQIKGSRLRRFGFVTTNSITQAFSRRVIEARTGGRVPLAIVSAIPDHPWTKATRDAAAVRIAMTVVERGSAEGTLREVVNELALDTDEPRVTFSERVGRINADLTVGADLGSAKPLRANLGLSSRGVSLHGAGFIVTPAEAEYLGLSRREGLERHIRPYRNGRDLLGRPRGALVIDLFGLSEPDVRQRFPEVWSHLHATVKPERDANRRDTYRNNWWIFGEPRRELRPALIGLRRYIATVETARHRIFEFLDGSILPDNMVVAIGSDAAFHLGVLSSRVHTEWALRAGGWLGVGNDPRYSKSLVLDPFPFPKASESMRLHIAALAEELDATRKAVRAEHPEWSMTMLYNVRAKHAVGEQLDLVEQDIHTRGRVAILAELHEQIDRAVSAAYGWSDDISADELLSRLVALNTERSAEERAGRVEWLRPDYQLARAGVVAIGSADSEPSFALPANVERNVRPALPRDRDGRVAAVIAALAARPVPVTTEALAASFKGGKPVRVTVERVLAAGARVGLIERGPSGWSLARAA
ncbi:class I SAM-dependent DNA methyltransferase [Sphingomonas floccifaciens]|uniref:site-specific DNA-methyltransferase (adenine-specific) n=1 Tax=Sphingomonas floccifaciens TaxID=1844115 RepID=A0ABW4NIJ2_9SPHN